jgi:serine O-acetyltransferase
VIGAGAKILGNIAIGPHARVAAGSVVLRPVDPFTTVAGIPAKVIRTETEPTTKSARGVPLDALAYGTILDFSI